MSKVKWGEYKLIDILKWQSQKEINPLHLSALEDINEKYYPFYGQSTLNNGIISYNRLTHNVLNNPNGKPTILIHSNNQNIVYLETPFYLKDGHGATSVLQCENLNRTNQMFIIAAIDKVIKEKFAYNHKATKIELKKTVIKLPTKNGKPDFDFMESFIAELEAQRIAELTAYLKVSGLDNCKLSGEEVQALQDYESLDFAEFDITDIFDVKNTSNILSSEIVENSGNIPYLCASSENNGVSSYITYDDHYLEKGDCIFIGGKTFVVSYQENDFFSNDSHNLALYLKTCDKSKSKTCDKSKSKHFYIATCLFKSLNHRYSWGNSISKTKIKNDKISLPMKDDRPNYDVMELLISAIQKLVIKDVVQYADRKIKATKVVTSQKTVSELGGIL